MAEPVRVTDAPPATKVVEVPATAAGEEEEQEEVVEAPKASVVPDVQQQEEEEDEKQRLSNDELLLKHFPRYFYDEKEIYYPIDLNKYIVDNSTVDGVNGVATRSKDRENTWLIYMSYYRFDGGVPQLGGTGSHEHDLETVIVEIANTDQSVRGVFYGPHSSHEHMWIRDQNDLNEILNNGGRPRVFVSRSKHASYPIRGKVYRLVGFGTDECINPTKRDRPLFILSQHSKNVELIDGTFAGPKKRITRDWSVAPLTRLSKVRTRRALPPVQQIQDELSKLAFWN
ncbi:unnamed protein product [Pylaiella littoralis]